MKSLLGLLSLVLIVSQLSFGYVLNKSPKSGERSFKINLFEYTFDNSVLVQPNDEFSFTGSPYVSLPNNYNYKPDPNNDETITLTDFTSITQPTSNGQSCIVPFLSNGISNFFCVDKQDATDSFECETEAGFGDCNLGKFMQVKRGATGNYYSALVNFKAPFILYATASYEFALNYLLNVDICDRNDYSLKVIFYNQDFNQVIFSLEDAQDDTNDKWNEARIEFQLGQTGQAFLLIQVDGYCATAVNDAFIAIDNIELNQLSEPQESTITTTSTVPSTTTTTIPITTTVTVTIPSSSIAVSSSSSRLPTLPSSISSILPSSISPIRSTSTQATEASTEQPEETEEPSTATTTTTTTTTTATTTTTITSTTTSTTTQTTVRTTQSTAPPTTEPPKGDDVLLIVLLSTLIPITVIAVGGGVFFYFYKKKSSKTSDSSALEMDAPKTSKDA